MMRFWTALLHTLSRFSPPVSPFQPNSSSASDVKLQPPSGHSITSTGASLLKSAADKGPDLGNLKRDIVNLLGVLSFQRMADDRDQVKRVQDTVRENGGLIDILNMTQLDERNPCEWSKIAFARSSLSIHSCVLQTSERDRSSPFGIYCLAIKNRKIWSQRFSQLHE